MPAVAVVGLGLMGSSLALALKEARPDVVVVGSDGDPATLRKAVDRGIVTTASAGLDVLEIAEIVGCPLNTALGRMHKAMLKLKEVMYAAPTGK